MKRVYLDHAATSNPYPEVLDVMRKAWEEGYANPSSVHREGQTARRMLEEGREAIANLLDCSSEELFFTSGGTESNNWALRSLWKMMQSQGSSNAHKRDHIIVSSIEHPSILRTVKDLSDSGAKVTFLPVDFQGLISSESLENALSPDTSFVSVMYANNEIGTVEPIKELGRICHEKGVLLHTDAVQAAGAMPISIRDLDCDLLSFSGHKFGGPKGIGGLFIRKGIDLPSFLTGGEQEYGHRAGTQNLSGVLGMAEALKISTTDIEKKSANIKAIRNHLIEEVLTNIPGSHLCGHPDLRLPGNAHFLFDDIDGEALLLYLNLAGFACSSGSACTSGSTEVSHVLKALGISDQKARSALRISIGYENTEEEVLSIVPELLRIITDLRKR